jgi:hypothetical protein
MDQQDKLKVAQEAREVEKLKRVAREAGEAAREAGDESKVAREAARAEQEVGAAEAGAAWGNLPSPSASASGRQRHCLDSNTVQAARKARAAAKAGHPGHTGEGAGTQKPIAGFFDLTQHNDGTVAPTVECSICMDVLPQAVRAHNWIVAAGCLGKRAILTKF